MKVKAEKKSMLALFNKTGMRFSLSMVFQKEHPVPLYEWMDKGKTQASLLIRCNLKGHRGVKEEQKEVLPPPPLFFPKNCHLSSCRSAESKKLYYPKTKNNLMWEISTTYKSSDLYCSGLFISCHSGNLFFSFSDNLLGIYTPGQTRKKSINFLQLHKFDQ